MLSADCFLASDDSRSSEVPSFGIDLCYFLGCLLNMGEVVAGQLTAPFSVWQRSVPDAMGRM